MYKSLVLFNETTLMLIAHSNITFTHTINPLTPQPHSIMGFTGAGVYEIVPYQAPKLNLNSWEGKMAAGAVVKT